MRKLAILLLLISLFSPLAAATEEEDFYVAQKAFGEGFYGAARNLFDKFTTEYPKSGRKDTARLFVAKSLFYEQDFQEAETVLSGLLDTASSEQIKAEALHWLGEINFQAKKYEKAVEFFKAVRDQYPDSAIFWWSTYSLGFSYVELEQKDKARKVLREVISESSPEEVKENAFFALAEMCYKDKQFDQLGDLARSWREAFPDSRRQDYMNFYLGESHYFFKQFSKAVDRYEASLKYTSDERLKDLIYQGLGWSWLEQDEFAKAQEWFGRISSEEVRLYALGSLSFKQRDFAGANTHFDKFIKAYPESTFLYKAYIGQAEALYNLGRVNDAFLYYNKIIDAREDIDDTQLLEEAYYSLGWCYLKMNDHKKAIEQFKRLALSGEAIIKISAQINIGDVYQESGDIAAALDIYEQVLEEFPNNLYSDYIQLQIGLCLLKQDDFEGCLLALESLMKNFSESNLLPEALYYSGLCHASLGNLDEAAAFLDRAVSEFSGSGVLRKVYLLMIQVYIDKGDYPKVLKIFERASRDFAQDRVFLERLKIQEGLLFVDQGQEALAKKLFKELLTSFPDSEFKDRILLYLANIYHKEQDYKNATLYYQRILEEVDASRYVYQARLNLAQIYWDEDKRDEAESLLKDNLESSSGEVIIQTKLMLIEFLLSSQEFKQALEVCDGLIADQSESKGFFYFKKAKIYEERGAWQLAYDNYQRAEGSGFDSAGLRFSKGYALEKMGNSSEAIKNFFEGIFIFPDDQDNVVRSYLRIARLYEELESFDQAQKAYEKIIDMGVEEAKYARQKLKALRGK
ncbi:tetratricopeptide repeat protein [Candidatus Omnitrophota bacterium]